MEVYAQVKLPVGKPDYDWECRAISISSPFRMKSSECYVRKWFEIECINISKTFTTTS